MLLLAGGREPAPVTIPVPEGLAERAPDRDAYTKPLGAAVNVDAALTDPLYVRRLITTFTSLTAENAMKWEVIEPRRGHFDFSGADAIVELAERTDKRVRGHTLVWDLQLPAWVGSRRWKPDELERALREHVRRVVSRYRGRVDQWDVVNEPLEEDGSLTPSVFFTTLGERFIDIAFQEARRADPDAKLFLNELASERPGTMQTGLLRLLRRLKRRDVPVDGVGLQNHAEVQVPLSAEEWAETFRRFGRLGLDVEITEMDVAIAPRFEGRLADQAEIYATAGLSCVRAENCTGLTVWGVTDRYSWMTAARRPLLFDAEGDPKPAAQALTSAMKAG
jgi:endo-1,4-beta-xylanase